jgi:hypothetical protein
LEVIKAFCKAAALAQELVCRTPPLTIDTKGLLNTRQTV